MERLIGLDLGSVTCGIAISDPLGMIARALTTVRFEPDNYEEALEKVLAVIHENHVSKVVLGLPRHMNGDIGVRGQVSQEFARMLEENGIQTELWDERLTTVAAERILISGNVKRKKRKQIIDQMAAVQILQSYLDRQSGGLKMPF
ncbi:Holliday junction resolvase RuvX [Allobaculum mucilyticum]|uniref:Holliday junction resolvase RuvX n=1 Tax=Allobaculum mucilyticum TaxID=2834459 RepID=UPI001E52762A|nr:Holliday junction resolvase RuvX [Allobaculum mucilyticum]UNT96390.1 Holliday junction resolvase RuvX [Allobaculum mucilyticum]